MRPHIGSFLAGLSAFVASSGGAFGADIPLSVLNAGPSSASIPATGDDPVAFILSPREIVNAAIGTQLPIADMAGNSLRVQDAANPGGQGVRARSRAVMAPFEVNGVNPPSLVVKANLDFSPTVGASAFVFLTEGAASGISTPAQLEAFLAGATAGVDYVRVPLNNAGFTAGSGPGGAFLDGDIAPDRLSIVGVEFPVRDFTTLDPGTPGPSDGGTGSAVAFPLGLLVLSDGVRSVPTEYFCVRTGPSPVRPAAASIETSGLFLLVRADRPLVTDGSNAVSPSDTNPAMIGEFAFRARFGGAGPSLSLPDFLGALSSPRVAFGYGVTGEFRDTVMIALNAPIDEADLPVVRGATIGFASGAVGQGIYSFAGETTDGSIATYAPITGGPCPALNNADTNGDGVINFADLNTVLGQFGQSGLFLPGDVDLDGFVNFNDLNAVLGAFGTSCD